MIDIIEDLSESICIHMGRVRAIPSHTWLVEAARGLYGQMGINRLFCGDSGEKGKGFDRLQNVKAFCTLRGCITLFYVVTSSSGFP